MKKIAGFVALWMCFGFGFPHSSIAGNATVLAPLHTVTVQVEYKNTQYELGSFGMVLTGPTDLIAAEPACIYRGQGTGDFGYDHNKVTFGGFADPGVKAGILLECTFTVGVVPTESDFSLTLSTLTDSDRIPIQNMLVGTDFFVVVKQNKL